jgi:homoserine kinase
MSSRLDDVLILFSDAIVDCHCSSSRSSMKSFPGAQTQIRARAFASGGIGNLGPGLDILGCALTGPGDSVEARLDGPPGVSIEEPGHDDLPRDAARHASGLAAQEVLRLAGRTSIGVTLRVEKGLPLAGGQGGSAASAVAGALATNALLGRPLDDRVLVGAALAAEEHVAGRHVDNIAPCLFGGILLIRHIDPLEFVRVPVPAWLRFAIARPNLALSTQRARQLLPDSVDRATALAQASAVATMVAALCMGDPFLLRGAVDDRIAEPVRAALIPGFHEVKRAALDAGALGCSISGAGPSIFALTDGDAAAETALRAMLAAFAANGVEADGRVASVDERGARIVEPA